jgi:hypothetical protein
MRVYSGRQAGNLIRDVLDGCKTNVLGFSINDGKDWR